MKKPSVKQKTKTHILGLLSFLTWLFYCVLFASIDGYSRLDNYAAGLQHDVAKYFIVFISVIPILFFAYGLTSSVVLTKIYKIFVSGDRWSKSAFWFTYTFVALVMLYGLFAINFAYNF